MQAAALASRVTRGREIMTDDAGVSYQVGPTVFMHASVRKPHASPGVANVAVLSRAIRMAA